MPFFSRKKIPSNNPPVDGISQTTKQPRLVCTWSAQAQSGPSPSPFPRDGHSLTAIETAAGKLFLFGGLVHGLASCDLYVFSTRDFSTALLQTSGEIPTPRCAHGAALIGTTLLIYGGATTTEIVPNHDSLYLLNLGASDPLISSPISADHGFALQNRGSGPALWSMVQGRAVATYIPQPWSVPSSSSSVVRLTGRLLMICGHSI